MTDRQAEVLEAIREFIKANGLPPTRADIGKLLNLSHQSSVDNHVFALSRKGWLKVMPGVERGIALLREGVPLYEPDDFRRGSSIAYGLDEQKNEPKWINDDELWKTFDVMPDLCLRIRGDAMDQAGLTDGGIVALADNPEAQNMPAVRDGDVVAARVGDDVVLRHYHRIDEGTIELRPNSSNPKHKAVRIETKDDVDIIGIVIGHMVAGRR